MVNSLTANSGTTVSPVRDGEPNPEQGKPQTLEQASKNKSRGPALLRSKTFSKVDAHAAEGVEDLNLAELRKALGLSQKELSELLNVSQPAVSKQERRKVIQLDTLSSIITAMGGSMEITATFPDRGKVRLLYSDVSKKTNPKN